MKFSFKPLCVMALLFFKLAQAAVLPVPTHASPCPQHSMQHMPAGMDSMSHAPCCKFAGCDCLQAPALTGPMPQAICFVGTAEPISPRSIGLPPNLSGNFLRPPIP